MGEVVSLNFGTQTTKVKQATAATEATAATISEHDITIPANYDLAWITNDHRTMEFDYTSLLGMREAFQDDPAIFEYLNVLIVSNINTKAFTPRVPINLCKVNVVDGDNNRRVASKLFSKTPKTK